MINIESAIQKVYIQNIKNGLDATTEHNSIELTEGVMSIDDRVVIPGSENHARWNRGLLVLANGADLVD